MVKDLKRPLPKNRVFNSAGVVHTSESSDGRRQVQGGPGLKATQAYTEELPGSSTYIIGWQ
eukprot:6365218-Alexandrium_andersonii.AAC.1